MQQPDRGCIIRIGVCGQLGHVGYGEDMGDDGGHGFGHDALPSIVWMEQEADLILVVHSGGADDALVQFDHEVDRLDLGRSDQSVEVFLCPGGAFMRRG